MPRSSSAGDASAPRREKPTGRLRRFATARRSGVDLLADCERLLLREHDEPQMQNGAVRRNDVIHPSEMAKADWCPRSTYLRIRNARDGVISRTEAAHFQLENIFEEGHEYHRKWQARFRRMGRLRGRWYCEACGHGWVDVSPLSCPECGAPAGAVTYHEVGLADPEHLIYGNADGEVVAADSEQDDVLIEVKSVGEGTIRQELPSVLAAHTYEVVEPRWGKTIKVLDHRGVWKDITTPFGPHLRQGLIYLRLRNDPDIKRIAFIYEYKPTSATKAFYVARDDEAVQELWDLAADVVHALDGGTPPSCINRRESCKACLEQETEHDAGTTSAGRAAQGQPAGRRRPGQGGAAASTATTVRRSRAAQGPDGPGGRRADGRAGGDDAVGRLLGRAASGR